MPTSVDTNVVVLPSGLALQESVSIVAGELVGVSDIYAAESHIQWIKQADGSVVAQMFATTDTNPGQGNRFLGVQLFAADDTNANTGLSILNIGAFSALPGNHGAGMVFTQQAAGVIARVAASLAGSGLNPVTVIDQAQRSHFLKVGQSGQTERKSLTGRIQAIWAGGSTQVGVTVNHGFNDANAKTIGTVRVLPGDLFPLSATVIGTNVDANNTNLWLITSGATPAAGSSTHIDYIIIESG